MNKLYDGALEGGQLKQVSWKLLLKFFKNNELKPIKEYEVIESISVVAGRKIIKPRSKKQLDYFNLVKKTNGFVCGPAGTGKTYLAVAYAVSMLKSGEIEKIILTRPAVEAGERLGFLPGDIKEKIDPYLRPIYDALNDMLSFFRGCKEN